MRIFRILSASLLILSLGVNHLRAVTKTTRLSSATQIRTTDNNNDFTEREKNVVSIPTKGLFDGKGQVSIDLSKIHRGDWAYPMKNGKVISQFGRRGRRSHSGADIKTHAGDTIYAAFDGVVRFAKSYYGYGRVIVLRHSNGLETLYGHNSRNLVHIGDKVHAGRPIAIVGRTGRATTEHCHFEVRINGRAYNPMLFFDSETQQLRSRRFVAYSNGRLTHENVVPENQMAENKEK